ncbi:hypothetical protein Daus18300_011852 [Diaporthe australafricana]|uniref:DUF2828 domain-containing protein n=1 Tax=Diaporthe australafricana TaxID=127596 RepID=A0ABR3W4S8_9PEZI
MASTNENNQDLWFLNSTFPVLFPTHPALSASENEVQAFLEQDVRRQAASGTTKGDFSDEDTATAIESEPVLISDASTTADIRDDLVRMSVGENEDHTMADVEDAAVEAPGQAHPFMAGLLSRQDSDSMGAEPARDMENKMLTENADVAHHSTNEILVDLFTELEDVISRPRLQELLHAAWQGDSASTLKIIFNARSIHLGKASRQTFYRCAGWLAKYHPLTLIANLAWLSRPVIQKKVEKDNKKNVDEDEMVFVGQDMDEDDPSRFDVKNGVAHGYWKDLLNILALYVNGKLDALANPRDILNIEREKSKAKWPKDEETAKVLRRGKRDDRHEAAIKAFEEDAVYRALYVTVARLFAAQLQSDLALLRSDDPKAKRNVSLCAKWAPSNARFHDKHTFIVSSIAEIMHPVSTFEGFAHYDESNKEQREFYLRHARESYRKELSALRKHLELVERDITAKTFENIHYDRVPSLAMNNYTPLFAQKDTDRFEEYIGKVADGKAQISGATLLPSTLIKAVRGGPRISDKRTKGTKDLIDAKMKELQSTALDGQWKSLVQRIKDSGTLENCIAVADVSGSMEYPVFPDGTVPMDSSIGLSLLVAEVTKPPFGGAFITFSEDPKVQKIRLTDTLQDKYQELLGSDWGMSTNFVAVFEKLILPMAIENKITQADMVKRVFVFSDMQFNSASHGKKNRWSTSYERIQKQYEEAGYAMPELVFWNLAGGRAGHMGSPGSSGGDPVAPKPVTAADQGTALVSGYSQGMLKVFLDNGSFEDEDAEEEIVEKIGDDGEVVVEKTKRHKMDPMSVVKRAIGHPAYKMLRVVD